jgi:large subunit ribosomal protein L21
LPAAAVDATDTAGEAAGAGTEGVAAAATAPGLPVLLLVHAATTASTATAAKAASRVRWVRTATSCPDLASSRGRSGNHHAIDRVMVTVASREWLAGAPRFDPHVRRYVLLEVGALDAPRSRASEVSRLDSLPIERWGTHPDVTGRSSAVYAIVRSGGRQHKVAVGDVLEVDRVAGEPGSSFTLPALLVVDGDSVTSDAAALGAVTVTAEVIDHTKGPKIHIMKYKNKTGYRKRQGHRQRHSQVRVTSIETGK